MDIIKETTSTTCVLRTTTYAKSLAYFDDLRQAAYRDFPYLQPYNINVVHFGGDRYKGTFGIEFRLSDTRANEAPASYTKIARVELTLG